MNIQKRVKIVDDYNNQWGVPGDIMIEWQEAVSRYLTNAGASNAGRVDQLYKEFMYIRDLNPLYR